MIGSFVSC